MTQTGGIDILIAWCTFGVLVALLAWFILRHHADPRAEIYRKDPYDGVLPDDHDDGDADRRG